MEKGNSLKVNYKLQNFNNISFFKIWKPVWISEWFPSPDHHDHHHHHEPEHGWDRKDTTSQAKVVWKRSDSLQTAVQQSPKTPAAIVPPLTPTSVADLPLTQDAKPTST